MNLSSFYACAAEIPDADKLITAVIKAHDFAQKEGLLPLQMCADEYRHELAFFLARIDLPSATFDGLTVREKEVLRLLCEDQTPKDIARRLNVDRKTVDSHKRNIFQKLGIQTMTQLVKFGLQNNLITL